MPALDDTLGDPCSLLNTRDYPTLWVADKNAGTTASDATVFPLIAANGSLVTYLNSLISGMTRGGGSAPMLAQPLQPNSQFALLQFLSGGGITSLANGGIDFTQLQNIVLSQQNPLIQSASQTCGDWNIELGICNGKVSKINIKGSTDALTKAAQQMMTKSIQSKMDMSSLPLPETIVDTYIVKALKKQYTYSTTKDPIMTPADFWTPSDMTSAGGIIASPSSLLGMLLSKGYLLQQVELFNPPEFLPNAAPPPSGTESLVYLYQLSQTPGYTLSSDQAARVMVLEAKNLRFFGAFLAEYCFYRTRYEWLLQKYFTIYTMQAKAGTSTAYIAPTASSPVFTSLFNGQGTADNQYSSAGSLSQTDYLKGLTYHLACLNTRMTDMRILLGNISNYYENVILQIQNTVNSQDMPGSNKDLTNKVLALNESAKKAKKYMTERDFHQGVMEYNAEKVRYSNILLGLYAFLNISAVAVIIQLSRS